MPERLKAILDKTTAWWKKFNTKQRSVLISIVAVVIVALVLVIAIPIWPGTCLQS